MGGEEFLVLLPGLTGPTGRRCSTGCAATSPRTPGAEVREGVVVTASIGVAAAPRTGPGAVRCWRLADRNLYRAKEAGRDRVVA